MQRRVTGECQVGAATGVNQDGTLICQTVQSSDWTASSGVVYTDNHVGSGGATQSVGSGSLTVRGESANGFAGMYVDSRSSGNEKPFYGYASNGAPRAWTEFSEALDQFRVNVGGYRLNISSNGEVAIPNLGHTGAGFTPVLVNSSGILVSGPAVHIHNISPISFDALSNASIVRSPQGFRYSSGPGGSFAPVQLPDGARIVRVLVWYVDDSTATLFVELWGTRHADLFNEKPATFTSVGESTGIQSAEANLMPEFAVIDNASRSYVVSVSSDNWSPLLLTSSVQNFYEY